MSKINKYSIWCALICMGECFCKCISEMIPYEKHASFLWESSFGEKVQIYTWINAFNHHSVQKLTNKLLEMYGR